MQPTHHPKARTALRRAVASAALVAGVCMLQACSTVKLAYNQAPHLMVWQLQRHLDLSDVQTERVRDEVNDLHQWHRSTMLAQHAQLLKAVQRQLPGDITAEQACSVYKGVRAQLDQVVDQAEPKLLWLATQLSEAQIRKLERRQAESNVDWRKEWLDLAPDKLREHRFKELLSRSEGFYGRLDEPQKAALRSFIARSSFDPQRTYDERVRRQKDLVQTLQKIQADRLNTQQASALVRGYLERLPQSPDPAYRRYAQQLVQEACEGFAQVHATMTPAQRQKAVQSVNGYEMDFLTLAMR